MILPLMLMLLTIWLMVLTPREGSKTDFILPPGHEERERERKKSSSLSMNRSAASFSTSNDPYVGRSMEKSVGKVFHRHKHDLHNHHNHHDHYDQSTNNNSTIGPAGKTREEVYQVTQPWANIKDITAGIFDSRTMMMMVILSTGMVFRVQILSHQGRTPWARP